MMRGKVKAIRMTAERKKDSPRRSFIAVSSSGEDKLVILMKLKFATVVGGRTATFSFIRITSNYMIPVWFTDFKYAPFPIVIMGRILNPPH